MPVPNKTKSKFFKGSIALLTDTIKVMLLTSSASYNVDTTEFISDINANEIAGTGYTAGGATLASKTVTEDNTNDLSVFDAADVTWTTSTLTARYIAIYKDTGTPSTSPVIRIIDMGGNQSTVAADFKITWNSNGILRF